VLLTLFTSSLYLAALVASLFAGYITKRCGRRVSMLGGGAIFLVGAVLNGLAQNVAMLIIGRIFLGKKFSAALLQTEWFAASHKKVDGPHLQIHQITFLLLRVGSIHLFVRGCKPLGLQQCCTKFFSSFSALASDSAIRYIFLICMYCSCFVTCMHS
jgi:MFS family permease